MQFLSPSSVKAGGKRIPKKQEIGILERQTKKTGLEKTSAIANVAKIQMMDALNDTLEKVSHGYTEVGTQLNECWISCGGTLEEQVSSEDEGQAFSVPGASNLALIFRSGTKPVFNHSTLNHTVSAPSAGSSPTPPPTSNSSKSIQDVVEQLWRRTLLSAENPQQCFNPEEKDMVNEHE
ncbi:hypothetical protein MJG53_002939 [Ovis ammon polii x Ovis aries]|uniref:Uncharacterized protein n=1 Tax=Ovis ammon polii x Ovis aries TaxID=2918886 RepID=A0ACB9VGE5_9CETA|nr:hypothetical protein MJT46_004285 [Ovis ammon polii x Ovis aries]KAI4588531.1 hypothetical protein MJG53_002939 [Ovis ammon polii x Ovis aries]